MKTITHWAYGFIKERIGKDNCLVLAEIYFKNKKPVGAAYVHWSELNPAELKMLFKDIESQVRNKYFLRVAKDGSIVKGALKP